MTSASSDRAAARGADPASDGGIERAGRPGDRGADPDLDALAAALAAIAPHGVMVGVRRIDAADVGRLRGAEAAFVDRAVAKRRREFATGRLLLRELIGTDSAILPGPTRAPLLPAGIVGSLAHDDVFAVAAIARDGAVVSLGIDVEPQGQLDDDVAAVVLRPEEAGLDAHLAFTLKEAAYKAWSGLGGRMLEHHDVTLRVEGARFTAGVVADAVTLAGSFTSAADRWVAIVASGPLVVSRRAG